MDDQFIQFKGVTKKFGKNVVLENVNLTIPEQKITGIIGASGEGKTTILKLLISFYKPTHGEVLYLRRNIMKDMVNVSQLFGFSTEDGSFYEDLTVKENIYHFGRLYGVKGDVIKERAQEIIELVNLAHAKDVLAKNLSIGMKKRLDIACALIHNPSVLVMDEPTADLDPLLRRQMLALIKKINAHGTTVILTTQILGEMDKICDRIAILFDKRIFEEGPPAKIKSKYKASNLNEVFAKIFSKRKGGPNYIPSEVNVNKNFSNLKFEKKKTLIYNPDEVRRILSLDEQIRNQGKEEQQRNKWQDRGGKPPVDNFKKDNQNDFKNKEPQKESDKKDDDGWRVV